jgi:hypothetical protein
MKRKKNCNKNKMNSTYEPNYICNQRTAKTTTMTTTTTTINIRRICCRIEHIVSCMCLGVGFCGSNNRGQNHCCRQYNDASCVTISRPTSLPHSHQPGTYPTPADNLSLFSHTFLRCF